MNEMRKNVKIAVIVPVYNGGKFLPEFLECLERQTMKDFEAYFVDDASTDDTAFLLQEAVRANEAFHYMRNEQRHGAAFSRNRGIADSESEYVLCLDADDMFAKDLLGQLATTAEEYHADLVMLERKDFSSDRLSESDSVRRKNAFLQDDRELYVKVPFQVKEQPQDFMLRCQNATYDRMVARSLLDEYRIHFQDLPSSNDVYFALFSMFAAKRIVHTHTFDVLYYRRLHSEPDRISNDRDPMCAYEALYAVKEALQKYNMWKECCVHFWIFALDSLEKQLFVCKREDRRRQVYQYLQMEGLQKLGVFDDLYFVKLPECYKKQFARLGTAPYDEKCFEDSMTFHALCESRMDKIAEIFSYAQEKGLKIGYWGVGRATEGFVAAAAAIGENVDYLIDNNREKQGKSVYGMTIVPYDMVAGQADFIIISNKQYYDEIFRQIKSGWEDKQVLCIQEYLYSGCRLEECIR